MIRTPILCLIAALTTIAQTVPTYTVSTFAGGAANGDGGWGIEAVLRWPGVMTFDNAGNLYIADRGSASVRKVTPEGLITTLAGTGRTGFSGDRGPASRAQLSCVIQGLAVDRQANVYISDGGNNRVRVVSAADGRIRTFVDGNQFPVPVGFGFSGIALDSAGNLYLCIRGYNQIYRFTPDGASSVYAGVFHGTQSAGDGGPATQASFVANNSIYMDSSDTLYVSDIAAYRVRKITPDGTIHAVAGSGKPGFGGDGGPAIEASTNGANNMTTDSTGNLYFSDFLNARIRKVTPDGMISTFLGTGLITRGGDGLPATQAEFEAVGLAISPWGDLYVSDNDWGVRVIRASDNIVHTVYGRVHNSPDGTLAQNSLLDFPQAFVGDGKGNFYVGDGTQVRKIDVNGVISTIAGRDRSTQGHGVVGETGDGGPASLATFGVPHAIALDASDNVYFVSASTVRRVGNDGIISTFAGGGNSAADGIPATQASFISIAGIVTDTTGSLYIGDNNGHRIRKVTPDGMISTIAGTGTAGTSGNGGPAISANINGPRGMAFDAAGNLYFADNIVNRVRKIAPDGTISAFAGTGAAAESGDGGPATQAALNGPLNVVVSPDGNVYISDFNGNTLRVVTPDGIIHTIASGHLVDQYAYLVYSGGAFGGDGVPSVGTHYGGIVAAALDGSNNIYLIERDGERIRVLTPDLQ